MKTRLPYAHNSAASFNTISLDDEHAAAVIASPPLSLSNNQRALPSSSTSRFIETCYSHFFPTSSRVGSNNSSNSAEAMTRTMSRQNDAESAVINASTCGRRRAKLTIAIDADEPYAGLAKLHTPSTPHTAGIMQTSSLSSKTISLNPAIRSRSASILSRTSVIRSDKLLKPKESVKSPNGMYLGGIFKRNESNISRQSANPVSPTLQNRIGRQDRPARGVSSVEYSLPTSSHFSSNSTSADFSSAISSAPITATASTTTRTAAPMLSCQNGHVETNDNSRNRDVVRDDNTAAVTTPGVRSLRSLEMDQMHSFEVEDESPYHNLECGSDIERRNHYQVHVHSEFLSPFQFAKVLESASMFAALNASVPHTSLANTGSCMMLSDSRALTRDDSSEKLTALSAAAAYNAADIRRRLCEYSLADEMREALRKYKGTPNLDLRTPDRIFKVVFVGDSGVGKTCFLNRFCHNRFRPLFNATIGVDFIVKTVRIRDRLVAAQLWDTAGQERFRSITKQYFRKADGVVLMYDVTSEQSYLNVRNWIESVRVGVDDECVMCLIGNKVDLYPNEECRTVTYKHGADLANEFDMIFFETSAYTGLGINDSMRALAFRLQQREEEHLAEAIRLEKNVINGARSQYCYCL